MYYSAKAPNHLRPRLHDTRQICIRTNNRVDTVCVYLSMQVINLLQKRTSAGQIFVRYPVET